MDPEEDSPEPGRTSGTSRIAVISLSFGLVLLTVFGAWKAISPIRRNGSSGEIGGYYVRLPDKVTVPADDPNGGASLAVDTNLPDGTRALIQYGALPEGEGGGGMSCCPEIESGHIEVTVNNSSCYLPPGATVSRGFAVTITVRPVFDNVALEGPRPHPTPGQSPPGPPAQPDAVLAVLGAKFENLTGHQVTTDGDVSQIVATHTYDWPPGTCAPERAAMVPETCPTAGESISEDSSVQAVANSVVGALQQVRLCELWGQSTPEFQVAHPWREFRVTWQRWLDGLGPLAGPPAHEFEGPLRAEVVQTSQETFAAPSNGTVLPERIVADYFYEDHRIAQVEFVHVGPGDPGVVPQFLIERFDLI